MVTKNYEKESKEYLKRKKDRQQKLEELKRYEPDILDGDEILDAYYHNYMDRAILNGWWGQLINIEIYNYIILI